jgi:hypothetical protein
MILKQFYLNCLAHASYLIGDPTTRTAAVVDPQRDIDQYLSFAGERGLRIAHEIAGGIAAWDTAKLPVQSSVRTSL